MIKTDAAPDLIVSSTTDDQAEVERVVGLKPQASESEENFGEVIKEEPKKPDEKIAATPEKPGDGEKPPAVAATNGRGTKRWQQRVDKLTGTVYQLKDDLARERSQREELERRLAVAGDGNGRTAEPPTADKNKKPEQKDFANYEEYNAALTEFNTRQALARAAAEEDQAVSQERLREMISNYNTRLAEFKQEHDDFDEVVGQEDIKIPEAVQLAVLELENGPDVAYYLGQHPELCEQLAGMTAVRSVAEIGRLSVALEKGNVAPTKVASNGNKVAAEKEPDGAKPAAAAPPAKKPVTAAPAPIEPASGSAPPETVPLDELPYEQYASTRRKQLAN